jgi:iron(III) transport system substrate-binding protein
VTRIALLALTALSLGACERSDEETSAPAARPEPVVVYASFGDEDYLPSLFAGFTRETGIPVTVRHRPEHQIVGEVIANRGSPPADLLLTQTVHGIWRAADEGALRPLQSQAISGIVPGHLRGPDGDWTAIGFSSIDVVCSAAKPEDCDAVEGYEDLGKPEIQGRLCLSASTLPVNRTLVAGLIADNGVRPAELIVRGWIANLALPPFDSEAALLQAVEAGTCDLAIASGFAFHAFARPTVAATWPQPGYFDVFAVGINRHARSPDAARSLAEWLVAPLAQGAIAESAGLGPVNAAVPANRAPSPLPDERHKPAIFGFHETDAVKLAQRARWY